MAGEVYARLEHPFAPVFDERSRVLILGSFPSVMSRQNGFYYGNPRNRFWDVIGAVLGEEAPGPAEERRVYLLRHRIALWDALASCDIRGSDDASIRGAKPNQLSLITDAAPIEIIAANGQLAGRYCRGYLEPELAARLVILPSTSPANAACSLERLIRDWCVIRRE